MAGGGSPYSPDPSLRGLVELLEQAILDVFAARQSFLLSGHERPDGDCLGSQVGLYHLLKALGKDVCIVNPDPVARTFAFLGAGTPFAHFDKKKPLPDFETAVLLDCATLSRLDALGEAIGKSGAEIAVIDHHVGSEAGDGRISFVDSSAASTGSLVYRLYKELSLPISPTAAEGMFLSLVADTGWFRYSNTDTRALAMAADLVSLGVEPSRLYDAMYRRNHVESVGMVESILSTHQFRHEGKYGYAAIDKAAMSKANSIDFDTDMVLEPLRSVDGVEVVALFKERFDGVVKISLRASGDIDVARIAGLFGGGGHVKAAGATLPGPLAQSIEEVEARVGEALVAAGMLGAQG